MIAVNKKYNNPVFFEKIMKRKYPLVLDFKSEDENMKSFYLKMIHYISKLQEEFDFSYPNIPSFNPEKYYKFLRLFNEFLYQLKTLRPSPDEFENSIDVELKDNRYITFELLKTGEFRYAILKFGEEMIGNIVTFDHFPKAGELAHLFVNEKVQKIDLLNGDNYIFSINHIYL